MSTKIIVHTSTYGRNAIAYRELVLKAARLQNKSLSSFLADAGEKEARRIVRRHEKIMMQAG